MFETNKYPIGLDISDTFLRLVQLKKANDFKFKHKNEIVKQDINCYNYIEVPTGFIKNGDILEEDKVVNLLKTLLLTTKGGKIIGNEVVTVLPATQTFVKLIKMPISSEPELAEAIPNELSKHFPIQIEDYYLDWQIMNQDDNEMEILLGAAPKKVVDQYTSILERVALQPTTLEIEANALHRNLINNNKTEDPENKHQENNSLIIDLGASRNSIIACSENSTFLTVDAPISGDMMTKKISETLNLTTEQAEKVKKVCGLNKNNCQGVVRELLDEEIEKLINYINQTISFFSTNHPDKKINSIILCGGGSNFLDIDKVLLEKLNLPTAKGDTWLKINKNSAEIFSQINKHNLSYATALGLALRETDPTS
jgi:type IV pilus assembly protein PilM